MEMGFNNLSDMCCTLKLHKSMILKSTISTLSMFGGRLCSQSHKSVLTKKTKRDQKEETLRTKMVFTLSANILSVTVQRIYIYTYMHALKLKPVVLG